MAVLTVGPSGQYGSVSAAVAAAQSGDTIEVASGTYTNDFPPDITTNLTLIAVGGMVNMVATEAPPNAKGILVAGAAGVTVTVTGFAFSGAQVADMNGAGIRYQGGTLILRNDYFHDNQDGLLASPDPNGVIRIANSEFADNGAGDGQSHNLYVGAIGTLSIDASYFTGAVVGHEIKSRAANTTIENSRIQDGPTGTASYAIDLPNGGNALVSGNVIEKGKLSQNPAIISFGEEGSVIPGSALVVSGNTILNDDVSPSSRAVVNDTTATAVIQGDAIFGLTTAEIAGGSGPAAIGGVTMLASEPALDTAPPWVACFTAGTRIATPDGPVRVESLASGMRVMLADGGSAEVVWLGHRRIDCTRHPRPEDVRPVRVAPHAFGLGRPERDLWLSPDHSVFIDDVLIPIRYLMNGVTVAQVAVDQVRYFHVELPRHAVLLAEGLPAESYLDTGNRAAFANGGTTVMAHADFAWGVWAAQGCAPIVIDGPARDAVFRRLIAQALVLRAEHAAPWTARARAGN